MRLSRLSFLLASAIAFGQEPAATVYGQAIPSGPAAESQKQFFDRLLPVFIREHAARLKLEATPQELAVLLKKTGGGQTSPDERGIARNFWQSLIINFKLNRALHQKYGGRVALSAFGFHVAIDGMIAQLQELERSGQFEIKDPQRRAAFYDSLDKMPGDGVVKGKSAAAAFQDPPWEKP